MAPIRIPYVSTFRVTELECLVTPFMETYQSLVNIHRSIVVWVSLFPRTYFHHLGSDFDGHLQRKFFIFTQNFCRFAVTFTGSVPVLTQFSTLPHKSIVELT